MDDLISRQAAIDAVAKALKGTFVEYEDIAEKIINKVPSAQPEIIRCKDCKYFAGEGMYCVQDIIVQYDHFYCYYAERREDE